MLTLVGFSGFDSVFKIYKLRLKKRYSPLMTNCKRTPFPVPSPRNFVSPLISTRFKDLVMSCKRCFGQMLSWASSGSLKCVGHPMSSNASRTRSWFSAGHLKCLGRALGLRPVRWNPWHCVKFLRLKVFDLVYRGGFIHNETLQTSSSCCERFDKNFP